MDTFDRVFCWTLTLAVGGAGCYFILTNEKIWESVCVGLFCSAYIVYIWATVRRDSRKIIADHERDLLLAAVIAVWRELESEHPELDRLERLKNIEHLSWIRYRRFIDRNNRLIPPPVAQKDGPGGGAKNQASYH